MASWCATRAATTGSQRRARGAGARPTRPGAGGGLGAVTDTLGRWGGGGAEVGPPHSGAGPVLGPLCKGARPGGVPAGGGVFFFAPRGDRRYWLLIPRPAPEVCFKPPGYPE